jgi:hypothetical protein
MTEQSAVSPLGGLASTPRRTPQLAQGSRAGGREAAGSPRGYPVGCIRGLGLREWAKPPRKAHGSPEGTKDALLILSGRLPSPGRGAARLGVGRPSPLH